MPSAIADPLASASTHAPQPTPAEVASLRFDDVYRAHFQDVCRWLRALGGPAADLDDLAQEVFLVVQRKFDQFDGRNVRGWLYRIASFTVRDHRRSVWFRSRLSWLTDGRHERVAETALLPSEQLEQRERWRLLYQLIDKLKPERREAFILFEVEGLSGQEIADLQGVPVATVWTRLHHARREFGVIAERHRLRAKEVG